MEKCFEDIEARLVFVKTDKPGNCQECILFNRGTYLCVNSHISCYATGYWTLKVDNDSSTKEESTETNKTEYFY